MMAKKQRMREEWNVLGAKQQNRESLFQALFAL